MRRRTKSPLLHAAGALLLPVLCVPAQERRSPTPAEIAALAERVRQDFSGRADHPRTLPFFAMRDAGEHIEVQVAEDDPWLAWVAIDGLSTARLVATSRAAFGDRWWKRLTEDLAQLAALMGHPLGDTVDVELRDARGAQVVRKGLAMTRDNRQRVKAAGYRQASSPGRQADAARDAEVAELAARVRREFSPAAAFPTTLPFTAMRAVGDEIEVRLADDAEWSRWHTIDGLPAARVVAVCRAAFGPQWWKRITEDLPQVLHLMGAPVGDRVDVELLHLETGARSRHELVPMTAENRRRVKSAQGGATVEQTGVPHTSSVSTAVVRTDAEALAELLRTRFSYARLRGDALERAVLRLRAWANEPAAGTEVPVVQLALAAQECLAASGDGHAGVLDLERITGGPWLPFLVEEVGGRFVAVRPDRRGFHLPAHPFLVALEGEPVERWLETAQRFVAAGSEQLARRRAVRGLREVQALRLLRGEAPAAELRATFADAKGTEATVRLVLAPQRPVYGAWPRPGRDLHAILAGDVGYLRIAQMASDPAFLDAIDAGMAAMRQTRGLIVDLRGNGGGSRAALRRFLPYILPEDVPARVVNVAAYHRACVDEGAADRGEALADRWLFPLDWPGWSEAQRTAVAAVARSFRPAWSPPAEDFGPWHYMAVSRSDNQRAFAYAGAVVVLIDNDCFSATDIFAAALQGLPRVTLLGRPTGGGSGRARVHTLPGSGLRLRLSTIASFRPDGSPYDGRGVEPDVRVEPEPHDFIGGGDAVLDAAVALVRRTGGK